MPYGTYHIPYFPPPPPPLPPPAPGAGPQPPTANLLAQTNYYVQRLIFQYASKPNAQAVIALLAKVGLMDDLTTLLRDAFILDTAVGPQLDVIGKYIGLTRQIGPGVALKFFGLKDSVLANPQNNYGLGDALVPASNSDVVMFDAAGNIGATTALA